MSVTITSRTTVKIKVEFTDNDIERILIEEARRQAKIEPGGPLVPVDIEIDTSSQGLLRGATVEFTRTIDQGVDDIESLG